MITRKALGAAKISTSNNQIDEVDWMDYEQSCRLLEKGILATKLNYSNRAEKKVILRLTDKRKSLTYETKLAAAQNRSHSCGLFKFGRGA